MLLSLQMPLAARKALKELGRGFEFLAEVYMWTRGYVILERRWKRAMGECDLVLSRGDILAFVEVKYRKNLGELLESWRIKQRKRLAKLAEEYRLKLPDMQVMLGFLGFWSGGVEHFWLDWRDLE